MSNLIPRNPNKLTIKPITITQTKELIKNAKPSNSTGDDIITMHVIKRLCPHILPHITHMITVIIFNSKYPQILKSSKITPTLKPDKDLHSIDSYRPINNLSTLDKLIEQYLKDNINDFCNDNNIIIPDHHGSRKYCSTITALAEINHTIYDQYDNNKKLAIIQTDLSSAVDTVDHSVLIKKLDHYGIRDKEATLISSFLENRYQFVEIDGIRSNKLKSIPCSVIQGSKLSSLLYNLYTNEIPLVYKIINTPLYNKITNANISINITNIFHKVIN